GDSKQTVRRQGDCVDRAGMTAEPRQSSSDIHGDKDELAVVAARERQLAVGGCRYRSHHSAGEWRRVLYPEAAAPHRYHSAIVYSYQHLSGLAKIRETTDPAAGLHETRKSSAVYLPDKGLAAVLRIGKGVLV